MLNNIFDVEDMPNHKIYEAAQTVIQDYMERKHCKIGLVASELETTTGVMYRQLNPKDYQMSLSIDRIVAITKLTGDTRIIEVLANEFDQVLVCKKKAQAKSSDLNLLVDIANMENSDVFRVVKKAIEDDQITPEEKEAILKEIDEAQKANAELKDRVLHIAIKDQD
nr:phage regulatory CII family protein [Malaciobacter halophilus]